ncbi:MAG: family 43 glycosylhydrolase [Ardenticatenaceae bacterium]
MQSAENLKSEFQISFLISPFRYLGLLAVIFFLIGIAASRLPDRAFSAPDLSSCDERWVVPQTKLKDHTFFHFEDYFYFVAISIELPAQDDRGEYTFAYARTQDFCTWENLGFILGPGAEGSPDESYIWAPHVIQEGDTFYMFYTGVNRHIAQTIMLATTTNPADPQSWQKLGAVFQPNHEGMIYPGPEASSNCRDPMIIKYNGQYYLYYTGTDQSGGIVGVAKAATLEGPWQDLGPVLESHANSMLESPFVLSQDGNFYLFYNHVPRDSYGGPQWRWAPSPFGPWQAPVKEVIGWAHDFALIESKWYVSYVVGNGQAVGVSPLSWLPTTPPSPLLGSRLFIPYIVK